MIKLHTTPVPGSKHPCAAQVQFQICIQHTHSHRVPVHNLPTFQHPDQLTEETDELGQEPKLDHLVAQLSVEGEVEQQAQGDVQQVLVVARDQLGQLLDDVELRLQAEAGVSKSVSK